MPRTLSTAQCNDHHDHYNGHDHHDNSDDEDNGFQRLEYRFYYSRLLERTGSRGLVSFGKFRALMFIFVLANAGKCSVVFSIYHSRIELLHCGLVFSQA